MKSLLFIATALALSGAASASDQLRFTGSCDGSAIAFVAGDRFATASDEENVLRVYATSGGADDAALRLDVGKTLNISKEADLEAAARIDDIIYWIGSLGSGSKGGPQPARRRFFATRVLADGRLEIAGSLEALQSEKLFTALLELPSLKQYALAEAALKPPKSPDALNIEGLASAGHGGLWIGLRNPLVGPLHKALVVHFTNPAKFISGEETPALGAVVELDLGGRGIRDMVFRPTQKDVLILAGPIDTGSDFALYRWSGRADDPTVFQHGLTSGDLNAEAMGLMSDGRLILLSDDGEVSERPGAKVCKDLRPGTGRFRGSIVTLGEVPGAPR